MWQSGTTQFRELYVDRLSGQENFCQTNILLRGRQEQEQKPRRLTNKNYGITFHCIMLWWEALWRLIRREKNILPTRELDTGTAKLSLPLYRSKPSISAISTNVSTLYTWWHTYYRTKPYDTMRPKLAPISSHFIAVKQTTIVGSLGINGCCLQQVGRWF